MTAGVRQGCPLSPLLFAIAADLLLRRLQRLVTDATPRAFADDLALVSQELMRDIPTLADLFHEYALISRMELNMGKTVVVPLWQTDPAVLRDQITALAPRWGAMKIDNAAEYLGFTLGPGSGGRSWHKPLAKFDERAELWGKVGCGFQLTLLAARVYLFSVLGFVAQLLPAPEFWPVHERAAIAMLFPGPRGWLSASVLRDPRPLGFSGSFPDLELLSLAARFRVATYEASNEGGIQVRSRARALRLDMTQSEFLYRRGSWDRWFQDAVILHLDNALDHFGELGWTSARVKAHILRNGTDDDVPAQAARCRRALQKTSLDILQRTRLEPCERFWRRRLARWRIGLPAAARPLRAQEILHLLRSALPPRVRAALVRTWFNGWCTGRRFQQRCACIFGCPAEDSIEHYSLCPQLCRNSPGGTSPCLLPPPRSLSFCCFHTLCRVSAGTSSSAWRSARRPCIDCIAAGSMRTPSRRPPPQP